MRVQRYVNDIEKIIEKTEIYGRELGIVGKYLNINIKSNIRNYLDMIYERKGFSREELIIIIKEFNEYLDYSLLDEYDDRMDSLLNMTSEQIDSNLQDIDSINELN
ncbi:MAG: hypothetical protein GX021_03205 [Tissierellia bacterium]|nr:hypothetical protein [Tissierellia bacterium]